MIIIKILAALLLKRVYKKEKKIKNSVYIGPNSIIHMGIAIRNKVTIGAQSLVNKNIKRILKYYREYIYVK